MRMIVIVAAVAFIALPIKIAESHRSGCHRWHSCPSDTGAYVCGDLGYNTYCPRRTAPVRAPAAKSPPLKSPPASTYDRGDWGRWSDADGDCQDTRQEVLITESLVRVGFETELECRVKSGLWVDPYTGRIYHDPSDLQIDHMVPLKEAHISGGLAWDADKKKAYFNDLDNPDHLMAVNGPVNGSKGHRDPTGWMPPNRSFWCDYIAAWVEVKAEWDLAVDDDERATVTAILGVCEGYRIRDRFEPGLRTMTDEEKRQRIKELLERNPDVLEYIR